MSEHNDIDTFALATHNGFVTMTNTVTGDHRTFRVRTTTFGYGDKAEKKRVVGLLTGSDNENDYINFGFVTDDGHVKVWRKFTGNGKKSAHEVYGVMLDDTRRDEFASRGFEYVVSSRCRRCNRTLTDPTSIELGIGPKCRGEE